MLKSFLIASALVALAGAAPAFAQSCPVNFRVEGTAMVTGMNFRSFQEFPNIESGRALTKLRQAMLAEGFSNIREDRANGALTALQETSGSGRPQTLRVVARKMGKGTRVDAVFMIQPGQVAEAPVVRNAICRVVSSAGN
jgi:hypothetical protein